MNLSDYFTIFITEYHRIFDPFWEFVQTDDSVKGMLAIIGLLYSALALLPKQKKISLQSTIASRADISAIAGNDVVATQLDLAKAYIEMDQKKLAKQMLKAVKKQGNYPQRSEARQLMKML